VNAPRSSAPVAESSAPVAEPPTERELRLWLAERRAALDGEVSHYPTPIAGCDLHLPALLDARAAVVRLLAHEPGPTFVAACIALAQTFDDPASARIASRADGH
jgi:hypothetical protein